MKRTVVGVLPDTFEFPTAGEVWVPLDEATLAGRAGASGASELTVFGILRDGLEKDGATAELSAYARPERQGKPGSATSVLALPFAGDDDTTTTVMSGLVAVLVLVLLVAASNIASLVSARTWSRSSELAVRTALGAPRSRIVGQLFAEVAILSAIASVIGLVLAQVALTYLVGMIGDIPFWMTFDPTIRTMAFVVALALLVSVVSGLAPALKVTSVNLNGALHAHGRGSIAGGFGSVGRVPMAIPIAIEPLDGQSQAITGSAPATEVSDGFLESIGGTPMAGRSFTANDFLVGSAPVAIVNKPFVDRFFDGRSPVGRRVNVSASGWREVIGVVPDLGVSAGDRGRAAGVYVPLPGRTPMLHLAIRSSGNPHTTAGPLRRALAEIDPKADLRGIRLLEDVGREQRLFLSAMASAMTALGVMTLLLSVVSIYALLSFMVTRRTREIGIRVALGARRSQVLATVAGSAFALLVVGTALGTILGVALAGFQSVMPIRMPDAGVTTPAIVIGALALASIAAAWVPTPVAGSRWRAVTIGAAIALVAMVLGWYAAAGTRESDAEPPSLRAELVPTPPDAFARRASRRLFSFTPDARALVYATTDPAARRIYRRDRNAPAGVAVAGTDGGYAPFLSSGRPSHSGSTRQAIWLRVFRPTRRAWS